MTKVIDADSHMFEQPGLWRDHMPSSQQHLALALEEDELGYTWLTHRGKRLLQCYISEPGKLWEILWACRTSASERGSPRSSATPTCRRPTETPLPAVMHSTDGESTSR